MEIVAYIDWESFMAKDDWTMMTFTKHPDNVKSETATRVRVTLDMPDSVDEERLAEVHVVEDEDKKRELVEKSILAAGDTEPLPAGGHDMGLDVELEYQTEIKSKINSLLWEVLPGGATMQEAELVVYNG